MRTFADLAEAVQFLSTAVAEDDRDALAAACQEELPPDWVLEQLRERNRDTPLTALYAGRRFPWTGDHLKLGGHDRELGHIHIDFVKSPAGWELKRIWMCR